MTRNAGDSDGGKVHFAQLCALLKILWQVWGITSRRGVWKHEDIDRDRIVHIKDYGRRRRKQETGTVALNGSGSGSARRL